MIRKMKETNIHSQVTSTIAGDDGEAVAKSEQNSKKKVPEKPNEVLEKPADAGWYVSVLKKINPKCEIEQLKETTLSSAWIEAMSKGQQPSAPEDYIEVEQ